MNILFNSIFEDLWKDTFFSWPDEVKPPITLRSYRQLPSEKEEGIAVQMAVAGYEEEDIKVYLDGEVIYVEGDNSHRENIPDKFKSKFVRYFPARKSLDLQKAKVELNTGILTIQIPLKEPEESRTYLLGKPPDKKALKE